MGDEFIRQIVRQCKNRKAFASLLRFQKASKRQYDYREQMEAQPRVADERANGGEAPPRGRLFTSFAGCPAVRLSGFPVFNRGNEN